MGYHCDCGNDYRRLSDLTKHIGKCKARQKRSRRIDELAESFSKSDGRETKRRKLERFEGSRTTSSSTKPATSKNGPDSKRLASEVAASQNPTLSSESQSGPSSEILRKPAASAQEASVDIPVIEGTCHICDESLAGEAPFMSQDDSFIQFGEEDLGRTQRIRRRTWKVLDMLPEGPAPLPPRSPSPEPQPELSEYRRAFVQLTEKVKLRLIDTVRTTTNTFGLSRIYYGRPTRIPDENLAIEELSGKVRTDISDTDKSDSPFTVSQTIQEAIYPYPNLSAWRIGDWFWRQGETKSKVGLKCLINQVILADGFNKEELRNVAWDTIDDKLAKGNSGGKLALADGWKESSVEILVPTGLKTSKDVKKKLKAKNTGDAHFLSDNPPAGRKFTVEGVFHRLLVPLVRDILQNNSSVLRFHFEPFRHIWKPNGQPTEERIFDEVYSSDAFLEEHNTLQNSPLEPGCTLPRVILALMLMSDATHLAQFGDASLWPVYLAFGNQRKYERCRPSMYATHHIAYLKKLPPQIVEFIRQIRGGKAANAATLTHCRRELFHAMIKLLLDPAFVYAWIHGIVVECYDGITRRVYFRLFAWSADYPEKVLLAAMRDGSECLCPTCLIRKSKIPLLGSASDMSLRMRYPRKPNRDLTYGVNAARKAIYEDGYVVNSKAVDVFLKEYSYVPTENAFQAALGDTAFNYFKIFTVDLMHEFELGVWKSFFIHILRILYTQGTSTVQEMDKRFRMVPAYGRGTIRRFQGNVSELKKLAARDFEDILQCIIPVIDGLLPEIYNTRILHVIWDLLMWHALAKLRMHSETTLKLFEQITKSVGKSLRIFTFEICNAFDTHETPRERAARQRREIQRSRNNLTITESQPAGQLNDSATSSAPTIRSKKFNMKTYKIHALGDYPRTIRWMGTTDSYSTQNSELEHKRAKNRYRFRTNKRQFVGQLAKAEARVRRMQQAAEILKRNGVKVPEHQVSLTEVTETVGPVSPEAHYHISHDTRHPLYYGSWIGRHPGDPALETFLERMKDHILSRLRGNLRVGEETEYTTDERNKLFFQHERIYRHSILRINYTTYDVCREQDTLNPRTSKRFIMVYSNEEAANSLSIKHPFWYAEVLGIFHANVRLDTPDGFTPYKLLDFLWVRWLGLEPGFQGRSQVGKLDRVGYVPSDDPEAFGFLDPDCIIRVAHLIPSFKDGRSVDLCPPSVARDPEGDWEYFVINRFVDRDMFMRYLGGGVGHINLQRHESEPFTPMESLEEDGEMEISVSSDSEAEPSGDETGSDNSDALGSKEILLEDSEEDTPTEFKGDGAEEEEGLWDEEEADRSDLDEQDVF